MPARILSLAVVAALTLAGSTAAQDRTKHRISGTARAAPVKLTGTLPNVSATLAGTLRLNGGIRGAFVSRVKYAGSSAANVLDFRGSFAAFGPHGSLSGNSRGHVTVVTANSVRLAGTLTVTRGTDIYSGARGKLHISANVTIPAPVPGVPIVLSPRGTPVKLRGTITY